MATFLAALAGGGPWVVLLLGASAFVFALSRGYIVRGSDLERLERRIEKDTDRVLALYVKQIDALLSAAKIKDETIASQDSQIAKLLDANGVATQALDRIVKEAERRGFFQT